MDTPEQFLEAMEKYSTQAQWLGEALLHDESDVVQMKLYLENGRAFFARWRKFVEVPEARELCQKLRDHYDEVEGLLEQAWREALREALKAREQAMMSALIHKGMVTTLEIDRLVPPHLREEFEKVLQGDSPEPFNREKEYRESEKDLDAAEEKARLALAKLEVDWPEKIDEAFRERWKNLANLDAVKAWQQETLGKS